ncbi:hypothetical protein DEO72_LG7g59 [Vigna unguiculata]|uniref:Uncharacterized protein n=1 Tax=Vigna unguiculata TaxID=3917 RepID=A0A4D6MBH4_VIGUN|nr:hypothetical protein DEO72_LG7g59 [Vigna unguiculata]
MTPNREQIVALMESQKTKEEDGLRKVLECSLAKPRSDQKSGGSNTQKSGPGLLASYPQHVGYGLVGGAYGALGAGYHALDGSKAYCNS